jgi:hypothetical protein
MASMPSTGTIMIDDVLPARAEFATREQGPGAWTGDVYKVVRILQEFRPDLRIDVFSVRIKGLAVIRNLDPASSILRENYEAIEAGILAGRWELRDVAQLRAEFAPHPPSEVAVVLARASP